MDRTLEIANLVLSELDSFESRFLVREFIPPASGIGARESLLTYQAQRRLKTEPFVAFIRVEELQEGKDKDWKEKIYLICRGVTPLGIKPITASASFLNYKSPVGRIASQEVGSEIDVPIPDGKRRAIKRVYILEKNVFTPSKGRDWDALNNYIHLKEDDERFIPSLREMLRGILKESKAQKGKVAPAIPATSKEISKEGLTLVEEIQQLEESILRTSLAEARKKQRKRKKVVEQIALRDQPILDSTQDSFFRLPIASQIILSGAPGTGKTTTLIKRLALNSSPEVLNDQEKASLGEDQIGQLFDPRTNWVMFTPNELLKIYLKEALNKEWLAAPDESVKIWNNERMELARDVLRFLKTGKTGIYTKTSLALLNAHTSADLVSYTRGFTDFYCTFLYRRITEAIDGMFNNRIDLNLISDENLGLAEGFIEFIGNCDKVRKKAVLGKEIIPSEERVFALIEDLSALRGSYLKVRKELDSRIEQNIGNVIARDPYILTEALTVSQLAKEKGEDERPLEEQRVLAKRHIRDALLWAAEYQHSKPKQAENKRLKKLYERMQLALSEKDRQGLQNELSLIGKVKRVFDVIDEWLRGYTNVIHRIPEYYSEYRLHLLSLNQGNPLNREHEKSIRERKLSENEIDILIFLMLRNARRAFQRKPKLLRGDSKDALLEGIKFRYRTQVAVDEATDFSAIRECAKDCVNGHSSVE